jgi:hypothetical protein
MRAVRLAQSAGLAVLAVAVWLAAVWLMLRLVGLGAVAVVLAALALAALFAGVGRLAPHPFAAAVAGAFALFGGLCVLFARDLEARTEPGMETTGGPGLLVAFAIASAFGGLVMAGGAAVGLHLRGRAARRPPPYP